MVRVVYARCFQMGHVTNKVITLHKQAEGKPKGSDESRPLVALSLRHHTG